MPTYEYECRACGESVEYFQSISAPPKTECPACGKAELARLIGAGAGFLFKGSGFYITDYRSADYQAKAKADGSSNSGSVAASSSSNGSSSKASSGGAKGKSSSSGK